LVGWQEGHLACKKLEWWCTGMVICLERDADLLMAQLMPLPLTVSCCSKIQIGFTVLVLAHLGSPGKRVVKRVRERCVDKWYENSVDRPNTVEENFSIFCLIQLHWLPSTRACGQ